jgi:hypothetical protein
MCVIDIEMPSSCKKCDLKANDVCLATKMHVKEFVEDDRRPTMLCPFRGELTMDQAIQVLDMLQKNERKHKVLSNGWVVTEPR